MEQKAVFVYLILRRKKETYQYEQAKRIYIN
jgi:hypothetical protein